MDRRKRFLVIGGGVLLSGLLLGSAVVEAWGPGSWFGGDGGRHGWFRHGPRDGKRMADMMLSRLDKKVATLNLTTEQKAKYEELRAGIKDQFAKAGEERTAMHDQFKSEMAKAEPDVTLLTGKMKTKVQDMSAAVQKHIDLFTAFYQSLDANQKSQVLSEVKKRMAEHDRRAGAGSK